MFPWVPLVPQDRKDPQDLLVIPVLMVLLGKWVYQGSMEKLESQVDKENQVAQESGVIKDAKVMACQASLEIRDQRVSKDVPAEPLMASLENQVIGDTLAGLGSGATQVSGDLQVSVSPLDVLSKTHPVGHVSQHHGD
ncbi:hypothetical protein XENORESO_013043 [Xenotaenia resolanae]|uniref:Uncharacterized protein n=1 Tax=Xenotaenia resolanae TaxID=208358 RepID=A0ABV0WQU4_9TELE